MTVSPLPSDFGDGRVVVVGGGIGGLACAVALSRRGIAVDVLERAPEIAEVGAGVQISPNGYAVLRALGLAPELRRRGLQSRAVTLRNGETGKIVLRMDLAGRDYHLIHRAALIDILARAAREGGVRIRTSTTVRDVRDGPRARLITDNGSFEADVVVGADGINSVVRPSLNGPSEAAFTGQVAWRATVPARAAAEAQVSMGRGRHLVAYPLDADRLNLVAVEERRDWAAEGWRIPGDPDDLRRAFADFAPPARDWLAAVGRCHLWGLYRHPVASAWHGRAVAILGDAAHPTLPFLAQGANLALEDAWCLAEALSHPDRQGALAAYQADRVPRVTRAIRAANGNARNYHLSGAQRSLAHMALQVAGRVPGLMLGRFDWLYQHDVTAAKGRL